MTIPFSLALPQPLKAWHSVRVVFGAWLLSKTDKLWPGILRCVRPRARPTTNKQRMRTYTPSCSFALLWPGILRCVRPCARAPRPTSKECVHIQFSANNGPRVKSAVNFFLTSPQDMMNVMLSRSLINHRHRKQRIPFCQHILLKTFWEVGERGRRALGLDWLVRLGSSWRVTRLLFCFGLEVLGLLKMLASSFWARGARSS